MLFKFLSYQESIRYMYRYNSWNLETTKVNGEWREAKDKRRRKKKSLFQMYLFLQRNTSGVLIARFMMQPYFHFTNVSFWIRILSHCFFKPRRKREKGLRLPSSLAWLTGKGAWYDTPRPFIRIIRDICIGIFICSSICR